MRSLTMRWFAVLACSVLVGGAANAIPSLQLYIDGASYDSGSETWVTTDSSFDIWVIGSGNKLPLTDVTLTAAVATGETGSITLTPTTTSVVSDPSTPGAPVSNGLSADGAVPQFGNGSSVPTHGIFGPGVSFFEWEMGDLTLADSPCGDFIDSFPSTLNKTCQINVYSVEVTGYSYVHFDAFGMDGNKPKKAPFSHDAELGGAPIPEPGAALLFGLGAMIVTRRAHRR